MNTNYLFEFFLLIISIIACRAGILPATSTGKYESKVTCPGFIQNDPTTPCWTLSGKCYCFSTKKRLDWMNADILCRDENMRLLTIETYEENQLIYNQVKAISQQPSVDYFWTSGKFSNNGWEWASAEPFQPMTYTNWFTGEPSHSQTGSFAYINFNFDNTGFWFDEIGSSSYILFICESIDGSMLTTTDATTAPTTTKTLTSTEAISTETTRSTTTTTPTTTTPTTRQTTTTPTTIQPFNCPDYLQGITSVQCWTMRGKCYCFSQLERDWAGADSFCRGEGMTLLKIESAQENDLIYNHYLATPEIIKDIYWTAGRYSRDGSDQWEWATTEPYEPFSYTNWDYPTQPDFCIDNGFNDCNPAYAEQFSVDISFFFSGNWYDVVNTRQMKFICESVV